VTKSVLSHLDTIHLTRT